MTTASVPSPLSVICPACNAQAGAPCTQPTDRSRNPVKFFHYPRVELALEPPTADPVEEILEQTRLQPEDFLIELAAEQASVEHEKILLDEDEIIRHPAELAAELEWQVEVAGSLIFDIHRLCGTVLVPNHRDMHEASCPAITAGMTAHEREEARRTHYSTTREENEERQIAWAISRHKRMRAPRDDRAGDLLRALGLKPFTIYSEGYAANEGRSGAVSHGVHWGRTFEDAIQRWKAEGGTDAQYLSDAGGRWTYWGCKLFDNLSDAQRSFG